MAFINPQEITLLKQSGLLNIRHRVNGLWNDILYRYFSATLENRTFTVSPEAYPHILRSSGLRADLLVSKLTHYHDGPESDSELSPVLCYKGQGASSSKGFAEIAMQLINWLEGTSAARKSERSLWAIGAKGTSFKVWVWCMECGLEGQLISVELAEGRLPKLLVDCDADTREPYDVVDDAILLHDLLRYIKDHPHPDLKEMFNGRRWSWVRRIWPETRRLNQD